MRVAIVVNGRAHESGVTSYINTVVDPLRARDCEVEVISPMGRTPYRPVKPSATKKADSLLSRFQGLTPAAYAASKLILFRYLWAGQREKPYDVVYGIDASAVLVGTWLKRQVPNLRLIERVGASIPLDMVAQGKLPADSRWLELFRNQERKAFEQADAIIPNSSWSESYVRSLVPTAKLLPRMISPVDPKLFAPDQSAWEAGRRELNLQPEERLIFFPSRLDARKGVLVLLEAFRQLLPDDPGIHLACVGRGRQEEPLREAIQQHGLEARVHLLGMRPRQEMRRWYNAADVVVVPSVPVEGYQEPLANCVLEAFACGGVLIASRLGGLPDAVDHEGNGLLAEPGNIEDLAAQLQRALADASLRESLRQGALAFSAEHCQPDVVAERLLQIFSGKGN